MTGRKTNRIKPHKGTLFVLCLLFTFSAAGCRETVKSLDDYLEQAHKYWGFEGTALVAVDGEIILSKGYGMANRTLGIPNTSQTKFYIGSITKQFTAAAILKLNERGKLSLNDNVKKYLTDFPDDPWSRITIQQLLTHTSGLPNYTDNPEINIRRTVPISDTSLVDYVRDLPLKYEPGERYLYSNSGYIILGAIIEKVSGQSYEAYLHHVLLKPLGMLDSGYGRRVTAVPNRADGYTIAADGDPANAPEVEFSILHTAGALYSTTEDILKWDKGLYNASVLSEKSITRMFTPQAGNYCYGWFVEKRFGRYHYYHGGFLDGFNTAYDRWIKDRLCILVFSNEDEAPVEKIARGLAAIIYGEPHTIPVRKSPVQLPDEIEAQYPGEYTNQEGQSLLISREQNELYANSPNQPLRMLKAESPDSLFFVQDNTVSVIFGRDSSGTINSLRYIDEDINSVYVRVSAEKGILDMHRGQYLKLDTAKLDEYVGTYSLDSQIGPPSDVFTLVVYRQGDSLFAVPYESEPVPIFPTGPDRFSHKVAEFRLDFTRDAENRVSGCLIRLSGAEVHGTLIPVN